MLMFCDLAHETSGSIVLLIMLENTHLYLTTLVANLYLSLFVENQLTPFHFSLKTNLHPFFLISLNEQYILDFAENVNDIFLLHIRSFIRETLPATRIINEQSLMYTLQLSNLTTDMTGPFTALTAFTSSSSSSSSSLWSHISQYF